MKLIFAGTPEFAAQALDAIIAAGHEVALVLTQPDRPSGRGLALRASPVKERALAAAKAMAAATAGAMRNSVPPQLIVTAPC